VHLWFFLSIGALVVGAVVVAVGRHAASKASSGLTADFKGGWVEGAPFRVLASAVAVAIYLLLFPVALHDPSGWPRAVFGALLETVQVFLASADVRAVADAFESSSGGLAEVESFYAVALLAIAPLMAVGFLLTFFRTFSSHLHYFLRRRREVNVFSELNERSITLATSIHRRNRTESRKDCVVFTGVPSSGHEPSGELIGQARRLGAACFGSDVLSFPFFHHSKKALLRIFLIGADEGENAAQAVALIEHPAYRSRNDTHLFVFSSTVQSEIALRHHSGKVQVRRVNSARALVYDWLWRDAGLGPQTTTSIIRRTSGLDLFENAEPDGEDRLISAVIVGLGDIGLEMLRALAWYCQMETPRGSYRLRIHAFDSDQRAEARFAADYPELAAGSPTGVPVAPGSPRWDAFYEIGVHSGVDATDPAFVERLLEIDPMTFVFVCLEDDVWNLRLALRLRRELARAGLSPQILATSQHSASVRRALAAEARRAENTASLPQMDLIGDVGDLYCFDTILKSEMEWSGLACHMAWAAVEQKDWEQSQESFWEDEYAYWSSIAGAIHWRARTRLGVSSGEEHHQSLMRLEHARWNAFVRGEGFVKGPRDLVVAKTHDRLGPYEDVPTADQGKDHNDPHSALVNLEADLSRQVRELEEQQRLGAADVARVELVRDRRRFLDSIWENVPGASRGSADQGDPGTISDSPRPPGEWDSGDSKVGGSLFGSEKRNQGIG